MFPLPSVWFLRAAFVYLFVGTTFGGVLMSQKLLLWNEKIWILLPLHYSILIWGFLIQFIMGTAYWMFPKHLSEYPRGSTSQVWFLFFSYNLGLVCVLLSMILGNVLYLNTFGKVLIAMAVMLFIKLIWVRSISYNP